jgi:hypothetical protein
MAVVSEDELICILPVLKRRPSARVSARPSALPTLSGPGFACRVLRSANADDCPAAAMQRDATTRRQPCIHASLYPCIHAPRPRCSDSIGDPHAAAALLRCCAAALLHTTVGTCAVRRPCHVGCGCCRPHGPNAPQRSKNWALTGGAFCAPSWSP